MAGSMRQIAEQGIYDGYGRRKYLSGAERKRFKQCVDELALPERCFCLMLYYTGLRISEALELTGNRVDISEGMITIRSLKRRKDKLFRAVPLPRVYLRELRRLHAPNEFHHPLWPFSRKTGYRIIKRIMRKAEVEGIQACPKGLRHGFGIACVQKNIPLPTIAKWMGHSSIQTTSIYLNAVGAEERQFAKRIW